MNTKSAVKNRPSMLESRYFTIPDISRADFVQLNLQDRCDSCNAAALVRAVKGDFNLFFCGNHGRRHVQRLISENWLIDDQTYRAFHKPSTSVEGREDK